MWFLPHTSFNWKTLHYFCISLQIVFMPYQSYRPIKSTQMAYITASCEKNLNSQPGEKGSLCNQLATMVALSLSVSLYQSLRISACACVCVYSNLYMQHLSTWRQALCLHIRGWGRGHSLYEGIWGGWLWETGHEWVYFWLVGPLNGFSTYNVQHTLLKRKCLFKYSLQEARVYFNTLLQKLILEKF